MQNRRLILVFLVIFPMVFGLVLSPDSFSFTTIQENDSTDSSKLVDSNDSDIGTKNAFALSQDTQEGVLNPNIITQRGHQYTDVLRARTDSGRNARQNITIDEANDWTVSKSEVQVGNLKQLYAVNGTFDNEVDPWTSSTYDASGGSQVQSAVWNSTEGYVTLVNYGEPYIHQIQDDTYTHHLDSEILWEQTVINSPQTDNFSLSFDYRYVSGPLDIEPYDFNGDVELRIYIGPRTYYLSIATSGQRNVWYSITDYPIDLTGAPASFIVGIGIYIEYEDIVLIENWDYDEDGVDDGLLNAQKIEVNLDNIEFTSQTPIPFADVSLTFDVEGSTSSITGPTGGVGTSTISNSLLWDIDPLEIEITANTTVTFDYLVTSYFQRDINSSWTTDLSEYGVSYSIDAGQSADLEMYTYVTTSSDYENLTLDIRIPTDWENTTIWDALQNDITGLCTVSAGSIFVPNSLFDRVGWWKITHQSFNYAKSTSVQIYDTGMWTASSVFRPSNLTRTHVELGTATATPSSGSPVNIEWVMPNGTIWTSESVSSIISGFADGSSLTFSGTNTSAGLWEVQTFWNNGTELAYGFATFELYHSAGATAQYPLIESDHGLVIANQIILTDTDNGEYLLDDSVSMTANWSDTTITFAQNYAKNWWQADFDTSIVEAGEYTVIVSISRPYFDAISVQFTVICTFETTLEITNAGAIPINNGLNEIFTVQIDYNLLNGSGIDGANIDVTHSGPGGGLTWNNFSVNNNGQYSVDIMCNRSGTYPIIITLNKSYHYSADDSFTMIIGETGTSLSSLNGTADVVLFGGDYTVVLEYLNSTSDGLTGATLAVEAVTPSIGLTVTGFTPLSNGLYSITLIPDEAGTFSVVMSASLLNHETQYITFTLTATGIPTILTALPSSETIAVDQSFTLQILFQEEEGSTLISYETIIIVNPPSGLLISAELPLDYGLYNITLTPLEIGTYDILFRGEADNYQSSSAAFTLVVTEIPTQLVFEGDVSRTTVEFEEPYELTVYYYRSDILTPTNVDGAIISVLAQDPGLVIDVVEHLGYYVITIRGEAIGTWSLTITANKTDHHIATKQFLFEVEEIDTSIEGSNPLEALLIGRSYGFTFSFIFEGNSSYVNGADIVPSGDAADWITFVELENGQYMVNLTSQELGEHSVLLSFEKVGFESGSFRLSFDVIRVPISVEILQGIIGAESSVSTVIVRISETDTESPVGGIQVFCFILDPNGAIISSVALEETTTTGEYSGQFLMPVAEGIYQIEITCEATNYILNTAFTENLHPSRNIATMLWVTTTRYYPIMIGLFALCAGLVYRRSARKKRIRENKATLAIKHRFDDIRSLMGVIVLHKDSGLPIYSKILRDGLEETVISAFITAITSFRGEFDIETSSEEWGLIPISDIVRVISTNKLVCAFITTGNPSPAQRERMISFAKTVGFIFDETMDEVPIVVLDHHTTQQFNALFEDLLDGQLLRTYKLDEVKKFPTTSCANERIARKHGEEFKLEELASEIASCGLEEGRVYKAIMDALDNEFLVTTDDSPFATELLRAPDTIEEEG